jgi:hypothetical protein
VAAASQARGRKHFVDGGRRRSAPAHPASRDQHDPIRRCGGGGPRPLHIGEGHGSCACGVDVALTADGIELAARGRGGV